MRPAPTNSAFTLVEVLFASAILAVAAFGAVYGVHRLSGLMREMSERMEAEAIGNDLVWEVFYGVTNASYSITGQKYVASDAEAEKRLPKFVSKNGTAYWPLRRAGVYEDPIYDLTIDDHPTGQVITVVFKWGKSGNRSGQFLQKEYTNTVFRPAGVKQGGS